MSEEIDKEHEALQIELADGTKLPPIIPYDLKVNIYPNKYLRTPTQETPKDLILEEDFQQAIAYMILAMYKNKGIGLAANQVGIKYSCFVWDSQWIQDGASKTTPNVIFNPQITLLDEVYTSGEGCLSCPGAHVPVPRHENVELVGLDIKGEEVIYAASGLEAAVFQHETDHLKGKIILDYQSNLKKNMYKRKSLKYRRVIKKWEKLDDRIKQKYVNKSRRNQEA